MTIALNPANTLPEDGTRGCLIGRAWVPGACPGPSPVVIRGDDVFDISQQAATVAGLLELESPGDVIRQTKGRRIGSLCELLDNSGDAPDPERSYLLSPVDLQVIKAAGVTFVDSMLERVIEEQAAGDGELASGLRARIYDLTGPDLRAVKPGSERAAALKQLLIERGMWSQYLEVGIGPDAEIFTKAPVLASVGSGASIGIHPHSSWNNPEPEVVLLVNSRGQIQGATLGNDVNLRDFEGRSALLLSKAKDNNASCAIGPFIRLFDASFTLDHLRNCEVELRVEGDEGFQMHGLSAMSAISRDPEDLVSQTLNASHQYPDGFALFLGTLFAPTQDRDRPGAGFTHRPGDTVTISTPMLGALRNRVTTSDQAPPWTFGLRALFDNLSRRRLL